MRGELMGPTPRDCAGNKHRWLHRCLFWRSDEEVSWMWPIHNSSSQGGLGCSMSLTLTSIMLAAAAAAAAAVWPGCCPSQYEPHPHLGSEIGQA
jgi:hypothetical protein